MATPTDTEIRLPQTGRVFAPDPLPPPHSGFGLRVVESLAALFVFALWLALFGGGILVDTSPYRAAISPGGATALEATGTPPVPPPSAAEPTPAVAADVSAPAPGPRAAPESPPRHGLLVSWAVVLLWFLPLNLALLCAVSGVLGAFGSRANLHDDGSHLPGRDDTNPYISALLRGFFVYLIMISGLLLLDDAPFSNPTPGQYIRLAGLLSLFSFIVNYNPAVFSRLLMLAAERMRARDEPPRDVRIERAEVALTRYRSTPDDGSRDAQDHRLSRLMDDLGENGATGNGRPDRPGPAS